MPTITVPAVTEEEFSVVTVPRTYHSYRLWCGTTFTVWDKLSLYALYVLAKNAFLTSDIETIINFSSWQTVGRISEEIARLVETGAAGNTNIDWSQTKLTESLDKFCCLGLTSTALRRLPSTNYSVIYRIRPRNDCYVAGVHLFEGLVQELVEHGDFTTQHSGTKQSYLSLLVVNDIHCIDGRQQTTMQQSVSLVETSSLEVIYEQRATKVLKDMHASVNF